MVPGAVKGGGRGANENSKLWKYVETGPERAAEGTPDHRRETTPEVERRTHAESDRDAHGQPEHAWGSRGERALQERLGSEERAERFYDEQMLGYLNARMREFVRRQEMFFLATSDSKGECGNTFRAGSPGFLQVLDNRTVAYPEYRGNGVFASLGNIEENPHVALLLLDFQQDRIGLHINGRARVVADDDMRAERPFMPVDPVPGRRAVVWVEVTVDEAYVHCSKHIPHLARVERAPHGEGRAWGTDDNRRKGGDYFGTAAAARARRGQDRRGPGRGRKQDPRPASPAARRSPAPMHPTPRRSLISTSTRRPPRTETSPGRPLTSNPETSRPPSNSLNTRASHNSRASHSARGRISTRTRHNTKGRTSTRTHQPSRSVPGTSSPSGGNHTGARTSPAPGSRATTDFSTSGNPGKQPTSRSKPGTGPPPSCPGVGSPASGDRKNRSPVGRWPSPPRRPHPTTPVVRTPGTPGTAFRPHRHPHSTHDAGTPPRPAPPRPRVGPPE